MTNAIITGATHGIGLAIAQKLAIEKCALSICARNIDELKETQAGLLQLGSPKVVIMQADLSLKQNAKDFAAFSIEQLKHIDILVNNAGVFKPGNLCEEPDGQIEFMMQTNLYAAYYISQLVAISMKANKRGHIFNMCSVASLKAYPNGGSYSISKYALLGLSDNLREELINDFIKVTSICLGATESRSWQGSGVATGRMIPAQDVANNLWSIYNMAASSCVETILIRPQLGDI